jgi:adenylosuccinate synthase
LPGWNASTEGITKLEDLPENARQYINFISREIDVEIGLVSTGPERGQTIVVEDSTLGAWLAS